ncbi:DUF3426 domain-containing protein [Paucidesulfovibrio longus]|uniref:DUF3426 domain-containing protein n=1 Tax=Paucidesulfovibrio longus TaxID=889 RepID=UPI0003B61C50|nr:DUF3426 domain-containing protein [Paucidesulfovibrio longus]
MIVACPSCETKYNLPDGKITAKGLKVKCAKCEHVFRVTPPPPEEETEILTDDMVQAPTPPKAQKPPKAAAPVPEPDSDFDKAFEEAVADGGDDFGGDFDEDFAAEAPAGGAEGDLNLDDDEAGDDLFAGFADADEDEKESAETDGGFGSFNLDDDSEDDVLSGAPDDDFGLADEDLEDENAAPDLVADDSEEEEYDDEARSDLFHSLSGDDLDLEPKRKGGGFGKFLLYLILLLLLGAAGAIVTFNFGMWSLPDSMQTMGVQLGTELPFKVPFVLGPDEPQQPEPGELPAERIKNIQPVDFRQYVITNEHAGPLFVVEGKALNKFQEAKERIKVLVTLFDEQGNVLATQEQMCGNTLSLLQLQVQTKEEIEESLNSSAGIYANNSFIKPDQTTPFMVVFFDPPKNVKEYQIEIVDARDPKR